MGCGSSKTAVAVLDAPVNNNNNEEKLPLKKHPSSLDHFMVNSSVQQLKAEKLSNSDGNIQKELRKELQTLRKTNSCASLKSVAAGNVTGNEINKSLSSLKNNNNNNNNIDNKSLSSVKTQDKKSLRGDSAGSTKSGDSGIDDGSSRVGSGKSQISYTDSISSKTPSAVSKRSSAMKKLLRIDSNVSSNQENLILDDKVEGLNVLNRPKTRSGNVAFELMLDMPETGNAKKRPEKLAKIEKLEKRRKRSSKKRSKTKEDIDRKLQDANERKKMIDTEKKLKAKQFQHLSIHTSVEAFRPSDEPDSSIDISTFDDPSVPQ